MMNMNYNDNLYRMGISIISVNRGGESNSKDIELIVNNE